MFQYPLGDRRFGNHFLGYWSYWYSLFQYPLGDRRFGNGTVGNAGYGFVCVSVSSGGSKVWKLNHARYRLRDQDKFQYPLGDRRFGNLFRLLMVIVHLFVSVSSGGSKVWKFFCIANEYLAAFWFQYPLGDRRFGNYSIAIRICYFLICFSILWGIEGLEIDNGIKLTYNKIHVSVSSGGSKVWKFYWWWEWCR